MIAAFLLLVPWAGWLDFDFGQLKVYGISISAPAVMVLAVLSSVGTWSVISRIAKTVKIEGALLSIITGASLTIPVSEVIGPVTAVIAGAVAGFSAVMLQKKMTCPARNRPVVVAAGAMAAVYLVVVMSVLTVQSAYIWDTGDGIVSWIGTPEGIEESGFKSIWNNEIGFEYFAVTIPALLASWLVVRGKK